MKKIVVIVSMCMGSMFYAQSQQDNVFSDTEQAEQTDPATESEPGNPGPVPIDDYLPALLVVGVGLILWKKERRQEKVL